MWLERVQGGSASPTRNSLAERSLLRLCPEPVKAEESGLKRAPCLCKPTPLSLTQPQPLLLFSPPHMSTSQVLREWETITLKAMLKSVGITSPPSL